VLVKNINIFFVVHVAFCKIEILGIVLLILKIEDYEAIEVEGK
jgi:hypothetical protein